MSASGKFVLRIDPNLHEFFKKEAQKHQVSLNQLLVNKLTSTSNETNEKKIIKDITSLWNSELIGIVLFGSTVRGEQKASSDIDLLIVLEDTTKILRPLYKKWDQSFSSPEYNAYSPQFVHLPKKITSPSSIWLEVALEGEILYDTNDRIRQSIYRIKSKIASGKFIRKLSHGHPYWVKAGDLHAK